MSHTLRSARAEATRALILDTAERLFAEHGVLAVSNRQVSEAAGQGNNTAVGYHFGTKTDLVRAIARRRSAAIEERRAPMVAACAAAADGADGAGVRAWVGCLVRPVTEHLEALGTPSWFARFGAQITADPELRAIMTEESAASPSLPLLHAGLVRCAADLPADVEADRFVMIRLLIAHLCAERERELAGGAGGGWGTTADRLVDAVSGLWTAPVG